MWLHAVKNQLVGLILNVSPGLPYIYLNLLHLKKKYKCRFIKLCPHSLVLNLPKTSSSSSSFFFYSVEQWSVPMEGWYRLRSHVIRTSRNPLLLLAYMQSVLTLTTEDVWRMFTVRVCVKVCDVCSMCTLSCINKCGKAVLGKGIVWNIP